MTNEQTPDSGGADNKVAADDVIKNLKAEMNRKFGNFDTQIDALSKTNKALIDQLSNLNKPRNEQTKQEKKLSDLMYDDPEAFINEIETRASAKAESRVSQITQKQQQQTAEIQRLASDFPEIADQSSELFKRAEEIFKSHSEDERQNPLVLRSAVLQAAAEHGLKPSSKRSKSSEDDDFTLGNSSSSSKAKAEKKTKVSDETMEWARLLGVDLSKKEMSERLNKSANRSNWLKYEE